MRRLLALRKRYDLFGRGDLEFLHPENRRVLAFLRQRRRHLACWSSPTCRASPSTSSSTSRASSGAEPVELFGQTRFPPIGELPYLLTLGPHAFYWLAIEGGARSPRTPVDASGPR